MAKLHYAEAFDDEFALFLRERRSQTLAQMMSNAMEVEINMMSSKRGRYRVDPREQKKRKEEPQASTSSDPKFDSLVKVMERLVDKLSIRDKPPTKGNVPQIRNPNYRGPRQQDPNPPRIVQRGERIPNDPNNGNNDQVRPPFQHNLVDEEFFHEEHEEINSVGGEEEKCFLTKRQHDDHLRGLNVNTNDYQLGYQSGMVALQRELSLRNRDIIISKPQEEKDTIEASTSTPEGNREQIQANPRTGKGKGIVVNSPKKIKQK